MDKALKSKSIRPFIGAGDFNQSRRFYKQLGFNEIRIGNKLSLFHLRESIIFHLQDFYVKDRVENSMITLEVEDINSWLSDFNSKELTTSFETVKLSEISYEE